ncbi:MAG: hypothetical protein ACYC5N_04525 [Endomicrobiales bacterium]
MKQNTVVTKRKEFLRNLKHKSGTRSLVLNAPAALRDELEPEGFSDIAGTALKYDFALLFAPRKEDVEQFTSLAMETTKYDHPFWIAYPREGSAIRTDLDREKLTALLRLFGFLPVEQVSLGRDWSAVRFRPAKEVGPEQVPAVETGT